MTEMTYRWEAEHVMGEKTIWGPSLWPTMRGDYETPKEAAQRAAEYGANGQRYRLVRSDGEVILTLEPGWRKD